jgi:PTS system fructose-specific IIC component
LATAFPSLAPFLNPQRVLVLAGSPNKRTVLLELGDVVADAPEVGNRTAYLKALFDREDVTSTGIGGGIAVPHAQMASITGFAIGIGLVPEGCDFTAKDGKPVRVVVMIAAPEGDRPTYLKVLAAVAGRLSRPDVIAAMLAAPNAKAVIAAFAG